MVVMLVLTALLAALVGDLVVAQDSDYGSSPPVYPSPGTQGIGWEAAFARAEAFVANLTADEKAQLVTGTSGPCVGNIGAIPRLGFDGLCLQDGPLAIRQATYASVFPAGLTTAASWDKSLMNLRGVYLGAEFKGKGAHVALGPVVAPLGRAAYGGRNWEGFSPDPYLTGVAAEQTIMGMQQSGVQACLKHFIGYEQETQRNPSLSPDNVTIESVSSNIDDRTLHELYLWPFANGVKAGVASIMCSYNRINGSYACQNSKTQNGILKGELGFQGYVVSDWGGTHSGVASINAGLDMDMPGPLSFGGDQNSSFFGGNVTSAVNNGSVSETRVNDMITRIMTPYFFLQQDEYPPIDGEEPALNSDFPPYDYQFTLGASNVDVRDDHNQLIRELGSAGTVLLKNVGDTLPLKGPKTMGVFGNDAGDVVDGLYFSGAAFQNQYGYEYGTLPVAGGSGTGRLSYLVSPLEAIKTRAARDGTLVQYILNNTLLSTEGSSGLSSAILPVPEVCLVFLKTWASEGYDRVGLEADWNSTGVVESVTSYCNNTVVVTHSGGLNVMPWADNPNVTAILAAHLPGEESGNSIVDVLYGVVNPSGKLPYTVALDASDYNFAPITNSTALVETEDPNAWQSNFTEGLLIDYRHFDYYNQSVAFEFGFGLSYTTFNMSGIGVASVATGAGTGAGWGGGNTTGVSSTPPSTNTTSPGGNPALWETLYAVNVTVTNTGGVAGAAVPQLYVSLPQVPDEDPTPVNVLRGFDKIMLQPGQSQSVGFDLARRDLSYWDTSTQQWTIPSGPIGLNAGFSSRDFRQTTQVTVVS